MTNNTSNDSDRWVLVSIGCAECRTPDDEPLAEEVWYFDTADAAKEFLASENRGYGNWVDHPLGGYYSPYGSGDYWLFQPSTLKQGTAITV